MIQIPTSLERFQAAWEAAADCSVQSVPSEELMQMGVSGDNAPYADAKLRQAGALEMLMKELEPEQARTWAHSRSGAILLDACLVASPNDCFPPEQIAITATRLTSGRRPGQFGMLKIIGKRVRGSSMFVVPLGASSDLAYTANAVVSWRDRLAHDAKNMQRDREKLLRGY